ncbi:MAG: hypoxanthine phosphoribosyltransferase [Acetobacteraceae bacterium]|nr:hypoxanthine phosphoribosyltransferase [Acetobacteraceae bacterium]
MHIPEMDRILLDESEIQAKVGELAAAVSRDYRGKEVRLIAVLKGAVIFMADLARRLEVPVSFDFMAVSSYGHSTQSSGVVRILKDLDESIEGRHVLIVEDIVDTGLTLRYLLDLLEGRRPASLRVCALLDKVGGRKVAVPIHYRGFEIPNQFVVGYGLDYMERYRNVPFLFIMKPEAQAAGKPAV